MKLQERENTLPKAGQSIEQLVPPGNILAQIWPKSKTRTHLLRVRGFRVPDPPQARVGNITELRPSLCETFIHPWLAGRGERHPSVFVVEQTSALRPAET